jgi:outer membrane protein TolC
MKYVIIIFSILIGEAAAAQEGDTFTLKQCIQYALQNTPSAKNALLEQRIAKAKVNETVGIGLPQLSGSASLVHNSKLQRFFTTYNPGGGYIDLSGVPGIQAGDVAAAQNFFQLKSSGSASLSLSQLIFSGSYIVALQASSTYEELSQRSAEQTEQEIIEKVTKAYYTVLINRERVALFDANIARIDSLLRNTIALNQNGFAEGIEVDRVRVTFNTLKTDRDNALALDALTLQLLKFQMNYPTDRDLRVSGKIEEVEVDIGTTVASQPFSYDSRAEYRVLNVNKRLQQLNIRNEYATTLPSISALATLGLSTQSPNIGGLFKTNTNIEDQGGIGPDKWYNYSQFSVNLNLPLFTGLQTTHRIQQQKLKLIQLENNEIELKNSIDLEIRQATVAFNNALRSVIAQRENQQLAANIARVTKIKYQQGVGSSLEVTDAENQLRTAQVNYYSSLFDAMVAKVDLDKAYGRLAVPSTKD